jgi:hypothetical protein
MKYILFVALSVFACSTTARGADIISDSPHVFGGSRLYVGNLSYHDSSSDIFIDLSMTMGGPPLDPAPPAPGRTANMDGVVILSASLPGGSALGSPTSIPFSMSFFDIFVELNGAAAYYDTELLSLSIDGVYPNFGPFMIRESPTLASQGHYSVEALASGQFRIDSFFDVFTELSLDGGQTWTPSQSASHLQLVPEPSATALLGLVCPLILCRRRRL